MIKNKLVEGYGFIGTDPNTIYKFGNGKYKTFEGAEIVAENCLKARVKDLVVEGKTIQDTEDLSDIESVAEREENLVNIATVYENMLESGAEGSLFNPESNSAYDVYKMEIQPNTEYLFNLVGYEQTPWIRILDKNNITVKSQNLSSTELNYIWLLKTEDNSCYLVYNKPKTATGTFQVYKKENPYPVKIKINEESNYINLPIPLRSLPNSTCDTIEGNKLVQRVEKIVFDGSADESWGNGYISDGINNRFQITKRIELDESRHGSRLGYCDHFSVVINNSIPPVGSMRMTFTKEAIYFLFNPSTDIVPLENLSAWKTWLSENPVTVYYELETPIIHDLEIPQLSTTKGTNVITTTNNIKPNLKIKVKVK